MAELNSAVVRADAASPARWLMMLHGIFGAGRNWRSVARALVARRPDWGALLVDLREHGRSTGFRPPHTLAATAADLDTLEPPGKVAGVLGHSFGGKVALLRGRNDPGIEQVWVVDSTPEAREPAGAAWEMLMLLRRLPERFDDRDAAVAALAAAGVARPVALWMSTNLDWREGEYRWRLDLDAMEALLRDFFRQELWDVVERPREGLTIRFIRATDSPVLGAGAIERIRAAGEATGRVFLHAVEGGHWLNADNPEAVLGLLEQFL